jgi:hypothetical protein
MKHFLLFLLVLLTFGGVAFSTWSADKNTSITGSVRDQLGRPIGDARVRIMGGEEFVTTDTKGQFTLPLKSPSVKFFQFAVTAGKEGWLNGAVLHRPGMKSLTIMLQKVPQVDFTDYQMMITSPAGPLPQNLVMNRGRGMMANRDCGNCHTTHLWEWGASKMGKTALNTKVQEQYKQFVKEKRPDQENSCADCHLPIAALHNPGKTDLTIAVRENWNLSKGIECDFCHKIKEVEVSNKPGVQSITMTRVSLGSPFLAYGPYDDVVAMPMAASYNPLFKKSEYCSSCHQDGVALPDNQTWDVTSVYPQSENYPLYEKGRIIPNQWTYQEWFEWQSALPPDDEDKGRQCQDCHMNWTKEMLPYYRHIVSGQVRASMGVERKPKDIYPHTFTGATPIRLEGSVRLHVETEYDDGAELKVLVEVDNVNAGHWLPTGEHTRNMILLVHAESEDGRQLNFTDGPTVPDWGGTGDAENDYGGKPGKGFARITGDDKGNINVPVWRATKIVSDNRIKSKEADTSQYRFRLPEGWQEDDSLYVTATLIYRAEFRDGGPREPEDILMKEKSVETGNGEL